ncbi:MAG: hypothetical protein NC301_03690 [Bacteroides sp.]|nr:hypothetical protein [Bacteroides sp.]
MSSCHNNEPKEIVRLDLAEGDSLDAKREQWHKDFVDKYSAEIYPESESAFKEIIKQDLPSLDSVEAVLGDALKGEDVLLYGVVNPYNLAVANVDNRYYIALNHYLGADSDAYKGFPEYQRRFKTINRMPIDVVEAFIAAKYGNVTSDENTLLRPILYYGALHNQTLKMLPMGTSEALVLGMTDAEYQWCKDNEQRIWQKMIEEKLLYSTDMKVHDRLFRLSPSASIINVNAPGNTAHYIGLKIAQSFEKNTGEEALPNSDYVNDPQTLIKSKYTPQNATNRQ